MIGYATRDLFNITVHITIITETEVTNCFSKISDLKGNIQTFLNVVALSGT